MKRPKTFADPNFKRVALENLQLARFALEESKTHYWLACGTLLGCLREKDLIAHDRDLDVGVMIEDCSIELIESFVRQGFVPLRRFGDHDDGLEYAFHRRGVKTDIFFHYEDQDSIWMAVWRDGKNVRYVFPKIDRLEMVDFCGGQFSIPANALEFVERNTAPIGGRRMLAGTIFDHRSIYDSPLSVTGTSLRN